MNPALTRQESKPPEWPSTLDVQALVAAGWQPLPFMEFVVKIHSRCELACDYCYMYEMADQSWRQRPRRMPAAIVEKTAARIGEHVRTHNLDAITLIVHGGEPLLAGPEVLTRAVTAVRAAAGSGTRVEVTLQTNGIALDATYLRLFDELGVRVGVSLDGDAIANDRHRRFPNGRSSHAQVVRALERLSTSPFRHLFGGVLCTIDVRNDPVATYEALLRYDPPMVDFLLPHGTWTSPPPHRIPGSTATPYADWLTALFDRWYGASPQETRVRFFEEIMYLLVGGASASEAIGLSPARVIVVETDGSIEQSDMLKSAYHGAPATGLHVTRDPFDRAMRLPSVVARQIGVKALSDDCLACDIHRVCGGGLYPHRYRAGSGFANPSVYCPDLFQLITHIRRIMADDISALLAGRR